MSEVDIQSVAEEIIKLAPKNKTQAEIDSLIQKHLTDRDLFPIIRTTIGYKLQSLNGA